MAHHINLQDIHDTLVSVAFEAGRMIMAANPNDISQDTKMNCVSTYSCSIVHPFTNMRKKKNHKQPPTL